MKLYLKNLKQKIAVAEEYSFNAWLRDEILSDFKGKFSAPAEVYLEVENTGEMFLAKGKLKAKVILECSRCLKESEFPVDIDLYFNIVEKGLQGEFTEENVVFFTGDEVDITTYLEEEVMLSLPLQPLCKEDCRGLCPFCGADLNTGACRCQEQNIDPRWEKLKQLIR
ncbi:DUF177 domain-containing protein [Thermosyntropha sp.]|uniref:YceD family protein n=1 Tax=Thermosyntropha sp. TaxID=2740820 RepID=UPI0025E0840F|nr:DUF177 domain-containing protein [Thermosyntropha sp.]MBO8159443.1 DUF177 domain-containing protein [Thermosyntropha sp.]